MQIDDLLNKIEAAGVVGAGGGGFPTAEKLKARPEIIIINGAECEPLLKVDQQIMSRYPKTLLVTLNTLVKATGAKCGVIALKNKYRQAVAALNGEIETFVNIKVHLLDDVYPVGDEHLLVYSVTGKLIPPGGLPLQVGVVVINVETLYNIARALTGQPVTHKYLTINGEVEQAVTVKVPLGTTAAELMELAGVTKPDKYCLIEGGPCMGKLIFPGTPVSKTTKGLIVLPESHPLVTGYRRNLKQDLHRALAVCSQCNQCTDLCPRHLLGHPLEPHRVMRAIIYTKADAVALPQALLCSECGVCDLYVCPFGLSPRQMNRQVKAELAKAKFRTSWQGGEVSAWREGRQIPASRLVRRLGIEQYEKRGVAWVDTLFDVKEVRLPLKQHAGVAAIPVVQTGQQVMQGELIARKADGALGANLHASISGTVVTVNDEIIIRGGEA